MLRVRKGWLECDDPAKVEVALNMSETFPYDTYREMTRKSDKTTDRRPRLTDRHNEIIRMWNQQFQPAPRHRPGNAYQMLSDSAATDGANLPSEPRGSS